MPRCLKRCEDDPEAETNMQSLDYHQTVSPNSNEDAPDSSGSWANVGPTSGRQGRLWVNVGPTYIAVWDVVI